MRAYKIVQADRCSTQGVRVPWRIGRTRRAKASRVELCMEGFHSSPTPLDAFFNIHTSTLMATVDVSKSIDRASDDYGMGEKQVSSRCRCLGFRDIFQELVQVYVEAFARYVERQKPRQDESDLEEWGRERNATRSLAELVRQEYVGKSRSSMQEVAIRLGVYQLGRKALPDGTVGDFRRFFYLWSDSTDPSGIPALSFAIQYLCHVAGGEASGIPTPTFRANGKTDGATIAGAQAEFKIISDRLSELIGEGIGEG